ncbi:integral membrane protein [Rutstroemia sp. NJR-2017a BBW]|nr:integral membrane protein [Rutstroemia sp. NJR-2017a BBW]
MVAIIPVAVNLFFILLVSSAVALRLISRYLSGAKLWYDDWFIFAALRGGDPTFFLHVHYLAALCYAAGLMLTKLSVLCFYLRIFTIIHTLKLAIWTTSILIIVYWIVATITIVTQCHPIPRYWNSSISGTCLDEFKLIVGLAIPNIVLDFVPLFELLHSFVPSVLWSTGETSVGIFSSPIPSLTYLFRRAFSVLAPSQGSNDSRLPRNIDGIKPATFGSLPVRGPKRPLSENFSRLDDESNVSETEFSMSKPTARLIVFRGLATDGDDLGRNMDKHLPQIQVRKDIDAVYKDLEKGVR